LTCGVKRRSHIARFLPYGKRIDARGYRSPSHKQLPRPTKTSPAQTLMDNPAVAPHILIEAKQTRLQAARLVIQTASLLNQSRCARRELRNTCALSSLNRVQAEQICWRVVEVIDSSTALLDRRNLASVNRS
jgi:hypothetical protein